MRVYRDHQIIMRTYVPCSIVTMAIGMYLTLVSLFPTFNPECRDIILHGPIFFALPYLIVLLIGSPLFNLWYYHRLDDAARERVRSYLDQ